jgi:hypothetical protein
LPPLAGCRHQASHQADNRSRISLGYEQYLSIELGSRHVHIAGCARNPTGAWVTQQARNLSFTGLVARMRFLIHDKDSKFSAAFDELFRGEAIKVIDSHADPSTPGERVRRALRPHHVVRSGSVKPKPA